MTRNTASKSALLLLVAAALATHGQSILGSHYPLGIPRVIGSGTAIAMGGAATAVPLDHHILLGNPANLGRIDKTVFSSFLSIDGMRLSQGSAHSNHLSATPTQLSFAFPLRPVGTLGLSLSKRTDATVKYQAPPLDDTYLSPQVSSHQSGGVTGWEIGFGRSIGSLFHVGLSYERVYLRVDSTTISTLVDSRLDSERDSSHSIFRGNGLRAGVLIPVGDFHAGLTAEHVFSGPLHKSTGLYRLGDRDASGSPQAVTGFREAYERTVRLPSSFSLGLAWSGSPRWLVASDVSTTIWRSFSGDTLLPSVDRDFASSFSLGAQFVPAPNLLAPEYWETIQYRSGLRISALPLSDNAEFAFTVGAGLPLRGGGLLDLSLEVGNRSDRSFADFSETFVRLGLGFNGGRTWSRPSDGNY